MSETHPVLDDREYDKYARWKIAFGIDADPTGKPPFIWAERANAWIFTFVIMFGVPIMGYIDAPLGVDLMIAMFWFFLFPLYTLLELREITGQMEGRGSIDAPQARRQIRTAQLPHIGTLLAVVIWVVAWALTRGEPGGNPIKYGAVEFVIIIHAVFAITMSNYAVYGLLMELLKSAPRGERVERRMPPSN